MDNLEAILKDFANFLLKHKEEISERNLKLDENLVKIINDYLKNYKQKSIFKFPNYLKESLFINDPIIWVFSEEYFQEEAESEIERRLTDIELNRLCFCWNEDDDLDWHRLVMVREAIRAVTENPDEWSDVDKGYVEEKTEKISNTQSEHLSLRAGLQKLMEDQSKEETSLRIKRGIALKKLKLEGAKV